MYVIVNKSYLKIRFIYVLLNIESNMRLLNDILSL